jgi:hypothetical protein
MIAGCAGVVIKRIFREMDGHTSNARGFTRG